MFHRFNVLSKLDRPRCGWPSSHSLKSIILILLLLIVCSIPQALGQAIKVSTFIDEETLERCQEDAALADGDRDLQLSTDEYRSFLERYSYGGLENVDDFNELPLRFIIIFHWVACFCTFDPGADLDCCVGQEANIPFDKSVESQETLLVLCSQTNVMINDLFGSPTAMPSKSRSPSSAPVPPTLGPSLSFAPTPTPRPTLSPAPTLRPTLRPSLSPAPTRMLSTELPSMDPSTTLTLSPTLGASGNPARPSLSLEPTPTLRPTLSPSPTLRPTLRPSLSPEPSRRLFTEVPSMNPSVEQTVLPTLGASEKPTQTSNPPTNSPKPTLAPTFVPTYSPSIATNRPTVEGLLCINFQYTVRNEANLTADDIFLEIDNTLKLRLIIATETTLTGVLNDTFPLLARIIGSSLSAAHPDDSKEIETMKGVDAAFPDLSHVISLQRANATEQNPFSKTWGNRRRLLSLDRLITAVEYASTYALGGDQNSFNLVHEELNDFLHPLQRTGFSPMADAVDYSQRRLVYYTYDFPVTIVSIADAPFLLCSGAAETATSKCAIAKTQVCVVLGPDDDAEAVRRTIVAGMSKAFESGEFQGNIPPAPPGEPT